jgi:spermidine/putrescine transport system ATP-binding protein
MPGLPLLHLDRVSKRYGAVTVLHDIDLTVAANEFLTILGPSGSGKTTILRVIGGFETVDSGRLVFEGRDLAAVPINKRPFNTVFQDYALFHHMTVRDNVGYGLRVRGTPRAVLASRVEAVLATVGLEAFGARYPAQLSGGQRQRVALARAIVCEPSLILLDEPLAALDVELRAQMQRFLKDLQRRLGIAFVFITHDQEEAIALSDRIVVVRDGRIEQDGTPAGLYKRPRTPFVASFFGENNLLEGIAGLCAGGECRIETPLGPVVATCERPGPAPGEAVLVAIRPEHVALAAAGDAAADGGNGLEATVSQVRFLGANLLIEFAHPQLPGQVLKVRRLADSAAGAIAAGERMRLSWSVADATLVRRGGARA